MALNLRAVPVKITREKILHKNKLIMENLDDLLLEAAGRTGGSGKNRHSLPPVRRQREASYSDDDRESNDDNSDGNPGYTTRKPSGFQVPLKKRLDPSEKDDDRGRADDDHISGSDESDVGSDLYKDEDDKEQLAQLTELEREMILSDRAQRRDDQRLTERVRAKQSGKKTQAVKGTPDTPSSCVRSSARFAERTSAKDEALNELREKRLKQQDPEAQRKMRGLARGNSAARDSSLIKRKSASSDSDQSENQSQIHSRDEESAEGEDMVDSDEERSNKEEELTYEDIKEITIRRSKLAKWFMEPFFEEVIVGSFVRVGIGRRENKAYYRLCIVKNVVATEPHRQYRLEKKSTHKYLNVTWGRAEAGWLMSVISDSPPDEMDFNEWVKAMKKDGVPMPRRQDILEKQEAIQKAVTFVYSSETVKQMLQEKKSASVRPLNIAAEKDRLRKQKEAAKIEQNMAEVERIEARLQELEALSKQDKEKNSKAVKLAEMNKKNRADNFKNASELKPVNQGLKAGEAGYDPFSRRWTRSRNYYVPNTGGGDESAEAAANGGVTAKSFGLDGGSGVAAALEAGKLVDTNAPVDKGTGSDSFHNFEISISLADLQRFGGAQEGQLGFMERKQRIEEKMGQKVPDDDGRRYSLTLTISDYKRSRGLL